MKNIFKLATVAMTVTMFTGCGGGGGSASTNVAAYIEDAVTIIPMAKGVPVPIAAGYSIVDSSEDAVVDIIVVGTAKTATLTEGTASIKTR